MTPGMWRMRPRCWSLTDFDGVMMRQDPPFDMEYVTATWLLERAAASGARIFNDPRAIRDHSEKVVNRRVSASTPPKRRSRAMPPPLNAFIEKHGDVVLKPLDGMGGSSIFRVRRDDPNRNVIIEVLTQNGTQDHHGAALPAGDQGRRQAHPHHRRQARTLLSGPHSHGRRNARQSGRRRYARGAPADVNVIARSPKDLGPVLAARGLLLVGIDVIGDCLTEINVTSPTCFVEITEQSGFDVAAMFVDALEQRCR